MTGRPGTLYGLGVGPGDPELITLKALRILRAAKVIAYPAPDTGPSFARQIVEPQGLHRAGFAHRGPRHHVDANKTCTHR